MNSFCGGESACLITHCSTRPQHCVWQYGHTETSDRSWCWTEWSVRLPLIISTGWTFLLSSGSSYMYKQIMTLLLWACRKYPQDIIGVCVNPLDFTAPVSLWKLRLAADKSWLVEVNHKYTWGVMYFSLMSLGTWRHVDMLPDSGCISLPEWIHRRIHPQ